MLETGSRIAERYTVVGVLGEGGMGTVYEVRSDTLGHRLAMKVMNASLTNHRTVVERFRQEAGIQATLSHPGITRVFDLIDQDELLAIVMELVPAPTLRDLLESSPLEPDVVRGVAFELLSTLMACHAEGVAHRDLKPENVFVQRDDHGTIRCKIADFGVAKLLEEQSSDEALTRTRAFVGTYAYASPEQITRASGIDARSDLYSVGVMLWEMLSGLTPYRELDSAYAIQVAVVTEELPALPPSVPADLRRLVAELTRKERSARPQSAREALQILSTEAASYEGQTVPEGLAIGAAEAPTQVVGPTPAAAAGQPQDASTPKVASMDPLLSGPKSAPARSTSDRDLTQWDPPTDRAPAPRPPKPPTRAQRQVASRRALDGRLASLRPAALPVRLLARLLDEVLLQLTVLSCVGIIAYPFLAFVRGGWGGQGVGGRTLGVTIFAARSGVPAATWRMLVRNTIDLIGFQLPLALVVWPVGWVIYGFPTVFLAHVALLVWAFVYVLIEVFVGMSHPEGRRLADLISGTRAGRA